MSELELHTWLLRGVFALCPVVVFVLVFVSAPYGRHGRAGWGPTIPGRLGWVLMETPAVLGFLWVFLQGSARAEAVPLVLLALWQLHYVHRTYIFPFRLRSTRPMPVLVAVLAFTFQSLNAWINARWISHLGDYPVSWLLDPRFIVGAALFLTGMAINIHADTVLIHLREPGGTGYRIPEGGFYRWVSSANYFGEILIWCGWAVATWSWAGLSFAAFTIANLAPRAAENHRWYVDRFGGALPAGWKRLVPGVW